MCTESSKRIEADRHTHTHTQTHAPDFEVLSRVAPVKRSSMAAAQPHEALAAHHRRNRTLVVSRLLSRARVEVVLDWHPPRDGLAQALRVEGLAAAIHKARNAEPAHVCGDTDLCTISVQRRRSVEALLPAAMVQLEWQSAAGAATTSTWSKCTQSFHNVKAAQDSCTVCKAVMHDGDKALPVCEKQADTDGDLTPTVVRTASPPSCGPSSALRGCARGRDCGSRGYRTPRRTRGHRACDRDRDRDRDRDDHDRDCGHDRGGGRRETLCPSQLRLPAS